MSGMLVLVATPIGNLGDISHRAVEELGRADLVCCEDTRRTGRLLSHLNLSARLRRADEHTESHVAREVVQMLDDGKRVVLVSDAGTPGVSDPGQRLVEAAIEAGHEVISVPGASALLAALVVSGLSSERFVFEGFLDRKGAGRARQLAEIAGQSRTTVLYESPNRTEATLVDLAGVCGLDRRAVVARELTKLHEEHVRGTLDELAAWARDGIKGEIVIVVEGAPPLAAASDDEIVSALRIEISSGSSRRDAVATVTAAMEASKREVYRLALGLEDSSSSE